MNHSMTEAAGSELLLRRQWPTLVTICQDEKEGKDSWVFCGEEEGES